MWVRDFGYHPVKSLHFTEVETDAQLYHQVSQSPATLVAEGAPNSGFSACCWSQMSVRVHLLIWWALWNEGSNHCEYLFFFYFLRLVKKLVGGRARNLQSGLCTCLDFALHSQCPALGERREEMAWDSSWWHGAMERIWEKLLQQPGGWWMQKHLRQAGPHGRAPQGCRERYWLPSVHHFRLSDRQSPGRASPIPSLLQPWCPARFW